MICSASWLMRGIEVTGFSGACVASTIARLAMFLA